MDIHCVTSKWNKTVYDPYVNMLRTQTEAMSSILGGADSLTVEPFDTVFRHPDEFSERIARNQQLILREEAYFDKVADPSAGSYYIENLTSLIAENAWKQFLEIEDQGGFLHCIKSGYVQRNLEESGAKKLSNLASRKSILLGTNQYANPQEKISGTIDRNVLFGKKIVGEDLVVDPITLFRGSEQYEKIRIAVDTASRRPIVFLLPIGNPTMRKARSQFSANFFGCAGYKVIDNMGFNTVEESVTKSLEAKADIVVICSSDEEYMVLAPDIFSKLKESAIIVIAGDPECRNELKAAGLDNFIHIRSDVVETLNYFNSRLGIHF
jgi:methylmalonyl-CoA mutase